MALMRELFETRSMYNKDERSHKPFNDINFIFVLPERKQQQAGEPTAMQTRRARSFDLLSRFPI
jgi:hypothetical protein